MTQEIVACRVLIEQPAVVRHRLRRKAVTFFRPIPLFWAVGAIVNLLYCAWAITMTIILFLVDTSASMNQRTYLGTTLIDVAKGAVESFMKVIWTLISLLLLIFKGNHV